MSNGFKEAHKRNKEFEMHNRYLRKNYIKFMAKDKSCKVLELGCGMGQFYYFCNKNGYLYYTEIDASTENIEYIINKYDENPEVVVEDIISYLSSQKNREERYDVVVLNDVIEHLSKSEIFDVLDGAHRILNDEGVFL